MICRTARLLLLSLVVAGLADAALFVTSRGDGGVRRYDATTGAFVDLFIPGGTGGMADARGQASLPGGDLLVASFTTDNVLRFDGMTGALLGEFVSSGSGGLDGPFDIAFGPDGNLYVASSISAGPDGEILRYDGSTGAFVDVFATIATAPRTLAFGAGNLYAVGQGDSIFRLDDTTGMLLSSVIGDNPRGLAFGPDGNLYVGFNVANSVARYDGATGAFLDVFVPSGSGGLSSVLGLTFGPDGNLYVVEPGAARVLRYNSGTGAFLDEFVATGAGGLSDPQFALFAEQQVIPEPQTWTLLALGLLAAGLARRRSRL